MYILILTLISKNLDKLFVIIDVMLNISIQIFKLTCFLILDGFMKIIGIDPGSLITGYGIIDYSRSVLRVIDTGIIKINSKEQFAKRLNIIYDEIIQIILDHKPDILVIENVFYSRNVQSVLKLGQVRGVILLAAAKSKLPIVEYSPREIKLAVTGNGAASKVQVHRSMFQQLNLQDQSLTFDATDALAIAVCHSHRVKF